MPSDLEHLRWVVEGRSRNQSASMRLLTIVSSEADLLNKNVEMQAVAQNLTSVVFSLWRAVFLSEKKDLAEDSLADVREFLDILVADNAIIYATDKKYRNWSFRFYLDAAYSNLEKVCDSDLKVLDSSVVEELTSDDKGEWMLAQKAIETAIANFEAAVLAAKAGG